jgi:hypothetical protein
LFVVYAGIMPRHIRLARDSNTGTTPAGTAKPAAFGAAHQNIADFRGDSLVRDAALLSCTTIHGVFTDGERQTGIPLEAQKTTINLLDRQASFGLYRLLRLPDEPENGI